MERFLERFASGKQRPMPVNGPWTGLLVAWMGLLLALPVPLPFANLLPAAILCLLGGALLEQRPAWAWAALAASLGNTLYFLASFDLLVRALRGIWR
jgi:hypothetical protein